MEGVRLNNKMFFILFLSSNYNYFEGSEFTSFSRRKPVIFINSILGKFKCRFFGDFLNPGLKKIWLILTIICSLMAYRCLFCLGLGDITIMMLFFSLPENFSLFPWYAKGWAYDFFSLFCWLWNVLFWKFSNLQKGCRNSAVSTLILFS